MRIFELKNKDFKQYTQVVNSDLENLKAFNIEISEESEGLFLKEGFAIKETDWTNPAEVYEVCEKIMKSGKEPKEILYLLGEVLTHNKNDYIKDLKKEFYKLQIRIKRQREFNNRVIYHYQILKKEYNRSKSSYNLFKMKAKYGDSFHKNENKKSYKNRNEDEIAWKKANDAYNKQFNPNYVPLTNNEEQPKKKVVVIRKPKPKE